MCVDTVGVLPKNCITVQRSMHFVCTHFDEFLLLLNKTRLTHWDYDFLQEIMALLHC